MPTKAALFDQKYSKNSNIVKYYYILTMVHDISAIISNMVLVDLVLKRHILKSCKKSVFVEITVCIFSGFFGQ